MQMAAAFFPSAPSAPRAGGSPRVFWVYRFMLEAVRRRESWFLGGHLMPCFVLSFCLPRCPGHDFFFHCGEAEE